MITMSVSPSSLRAGEVLPAAADDAAPDGAPSFDALLRRHVAGQRHNPRFQGEPGPRTPADRRIDDDRPLRPTPDDAAASARRTAREPADPRGAIGEASDGEDQSAAAPSGQPPASPPEAAPPSAPVAPSPVAAVPPTATGQAIPLRADTMAGRVPPIAASPGHLVTPTASAGSPIAVTTADMTAATATMTATTENGLTVETVTTQLSTTEPTGTGSTGVTDTTGRAIPVPIDAAGIVQSVEPDSAAPPTQPVRPPNPATDAPMDGSAAARPGIQSAPGAAGWIAPGAAPGTTAPATGQIPLPPNATAAAAAGAAGASDPVTLSPTAADDAAAPGSSTDGRVATADTSVAAAITTTGARSNATGAGRALTPNAAATDAAATLPSPLHDAVVQAQRDLQIRRAEQQVTRLGIDLATEGLGAIHIEASNAGGGLQFQLGADRSATRQLLAEHAAALRDELGADGTAVSVDIGRGDAGSGNEPSQDRAVQQPLAGGQARRQAPSAPSERSDAAPVDTHRTLAGDGGLDVRL
jgi:flagellar hook-length control protein FliK